MKRRTKQKEAIVATLSSAPGPLSAEELWEGAKTLEPNLGLATVYRQVKALVEIDELAEVHLPNESTRFELKQKGHVHHFFCEGCKQFYYIKEACPVSALDGVTLPSGFNISHHRLTFYGQCSSCQA